MCPAIEPKKVIISGSILIASSFLSALIYFGFIFILDSFSDDIGIILGSLSDDPGIILGSLRGDGPVPRRLTLTWVGRRGSGDGTKRFPKGYKIRPKNYKILDDQEWYKIGSKVE